jgi:chromosome segregation ATPase
MSRIARFSRWTLALLIAVVAVGMTIGSASAAPAGRTADKVNAALSRRYKQEQQRLKLQDARLTRADEYATKIDGMIAKLKAKGKDTAALEQSVAAFRAGIAQARAEWQAASDVLAAHAGFDAAGTVSNADQARATLKSAHEHMESAHTIARGAYKTLHEAIVAYRKANREVKEPVAPVQP